jgi:hypothetical protein
VCDVLAALKAKNGKNLKKISSFFKIKLHNVGLFFRTILLGSQWCAVQDNLFFFFIDAAGTNFIK